MKNEFFNAHRFGILVKKQFAELKLTLMWVAIALFTVIVFITYLSARDSESIYVQTSQWNFYAGVLMISGIIFSNLFTKLRPDSQGLFEITLPASKFEKIANVILFSGIIYPLLYSLCYFAANYFSYYVLCKNDFIYMELMTFDFASWAIPFDASIVIMFILQSIYMLGAIWFKKHHFIKTSVYTFAVVAIIGVMFVLCQNTFPIFRIASEHPYAYVDAQSAVFNVAANILDKLLFLLPLFFWVTTYFRLGEKEI